MESSPLGFPRAIKANKRSSMGMMPVDADGAETSSDSSDSEMPMTTGQTESSSKIVQRVTSEPNRSTEKSQGFFSPPVDISPDQSGRVSKQIMRPGVEDEYPEYGDRVVVHHTGWLLDRESPLTVDRDRKESKNEFNLGRGYVIKGWDIAVASMKKGEVAMFIINPDYAYGERGNPPSIPPYATLLFEIELIGWKLEDLSPKKDGSILRKVIEKGDCYNNPNEGSQVKVKLVGKYNETVFQNCEKGFRLGEGCLANIPDGVEIALYKFFLNEKALIYLKNKYVLDKGLEGFGIPPETDIVFEVSLLNFVKAKDVWEMNSQEKFEKAKSSRERGITFIKAENFKVALRHFRWIPACLYKEPGVDPESKEARDSLLLSGFLNLSLCHLKLENYVDAIKSCDNALELDSENEKALYRRGQAKVLFNDAAEALLDFEKVFSLYPNNKAAEKYIKICKDRVKLQRQEDKSIYRNMFETFVKQDNEKLKNMKTETGVWESKEPEEGSSRQMSETEMLMEQNDSFLREANIIELSNTARK